MVEMVGPHPSNDSPSQNTDEAFSGGAWHFFAEHTPWLSDENAKPKP
jgi:hypothetical protein